MSRPLLWILFLLCGFTLLQMRGRIERLGESVELILKRLMALEEAVGYQSIKPQSGPAAEVSVGVITADYGQLWGLAEVDPPKERTRQEILERLDLLGQESELIRQVAENSGAYPQQLLEALANNPEMADFAAHFLEKKGMVTGSGLTEGEKDAEYPLFLQWDPRWGYASYGDDSVVGLTGCGPTALSMALYYLTGDASLTPDKLAAYSMENGYYIPGTGTAWLLMEQVPALYGLSVRQPEISRREMEQALEAGDVILCSMGPGDFTIGGHFVVIYGYDGEGFLINDPNCVARSRQSWSFETLEPQMKHIFIISKDSGQEGQYQITRQEGASVRKIEN